MTVMAKIPLLKWIWWLFAVWCLLGTGPVYYAIWFIWKCATLAFPRWVYESGDDFLYSLYQKFVLFFCQYCSGVELIFSGDIDAVSRQKENVIFICNHQSSVDWMIANMVAIQQGSIGHIRYILKDSLKYLPFYGAYFRQHSCVYVRRSGQFRANQAQEQLDEIAKHRTPFWMVIFPEGTRYNPRLPHVIQKSQEFAKSRGLPIFHHVLMPRSKGLWLCTERLRQCTSAIYDVTIAYSKTLKSTSNDISTFHAAAPTLSELIFGECRRLYVHIQRVPMENIPQDSDIFNQWLLDQFVVKERLLEGFYSSNPARMGRLQSDTDAAEQKYVHESLPISCTLPAVLFWSLLDIPLWFTASGIIVYISIVIAGAIFSLSWAVLMI